MSAEIQGFVLLSVTGHFAVTSEQATHTNSEVRRISRFTEDINEASIHDEIEWSRIRQKSSPEMLFVSAGLHPAVANRVVKLQNRARTTK